MSRKTETLDVSALVEFMRDAGFSNETLADRSGVELRRIKGWRKVLPLVDVEVRIETLEAIARALDIKTAWIISGKPKHV